jgi:PilZ domain
MTPEMAFECLLVSHDPGLYGTINAVLGKFSIAVHHCLTPSKACDSITGRNHELVVIDWEGDASSQLLHAIWNLPKKRKPTILAISVDDRSVTGAHFTLRKPVTTQSATELLRAAYSRMLLDYRLNARHAVMTPLTAKDDSGRSVSVTVTDVGEGGIGLSSKQKLTVGDALSFTLRLPRTALPIHIQARIVWTRDYGTAGCDFLNIPPVDRDILRDWLKGKTQVKKPMISI